MVKYGAFIGYIWSQWLHIRLRINLRTTEKDEPRKMKEKRFTRVCRAIVAAIHLMIIPFPQVTIRFIEEIYTVD